MNKKIQKICLQSSAGENKSVELNEKCLNSDYEDKYKKITTESFEKIKKDLKTFTLDENPKYENISKANVDSIINKINVYSNINNKILILINNNIADTLILESQFLKYYNSIINQEDKVVIPKSIEQKKIAKSRQDLRNSAGDTIRLVVHSTGKNPKFEFVDVNSNQRIVSQESLVELDNYLANHKDVLPKAERAAEEKENTGLDENKNQGFNLAFAYVKKHFLNNKVEINTQETGKNITNYINDKLATYLRDITINYSVRQYLFDKNKYRILYFAYIALTLIWVELFKGEKKQTDSSAKSFSSSADSESPAPSTSDKTFQQIKKEYADKLKVKITDLGGDLKNIDHLNKAINDIRGSEISQKKKTIYIQILNELKKELEK